MDVTGLGNSCHLATPPLLLFVVGPGLTTLNKLLASFAKILPNSYLTPSHPHPHLQKDQRAQGKQNEQLVCDEDNTAIF